MRWARSIGLLAISASVAVHGQPASRRITNIEALQAFPGFYHLRPITVAGAISLDDGGRLRLTTSAGSLPVVSKESAPDGDAEVRGEFWDIGRMNADDPRLSTYDLRQTFRFDPEGPWPQPGQVTALVASSIVPATIPASPSIRTLVLHPSRYVDQTVTIAGQFSGRNLFGELPDSPSNSQFDFVLRSAEGAVWVSHIRPRGRDFNLALDARVDTARWLQVTGVLQQGRGLQWLDATNGSVELTKPVETTSVDEPPAPAAPAPEVLFSVPAHEEVEISTTTNVRVQFSRNIDAATLRDRVRMIYVGTGSSGEARAGSLGDVPAEIEIRTEYRAAARALEITPAVALRPFLKVQVELLEGILGTDGQPLAPWTLTFATGG
jgi:hypothetical protein